MKTMVYVIVPPEVASDEISKWVDKTLSPHKVTTNGIMLKGRYDYLVGTSSEVPLDDPITLGRLPNREKRALAGQICAIARLPSERIPGALITPDGIWHDQRDFGWRFVDEGTPAFQHVVANWTARYRELIEQHPFCLVVEVWAHS
jgi:hypothetical protein